MNAVRVLAAHELREALRNRWLLAYAALFATLALGLSLVGLRLAGAVGLEGYGRTTASVLNLTLGLVPLAALLLAATGLTGDREVGTLEVFLAHPISRAEFILGRFLGAFGAVALATVLGFGVAGALIGLATGAAGGLQYLAFLGIALALGATSLAIGTAIAVSVRTRLQASGLALAAWFASVVLLDLIVIAVGATAGAGVRALAAAVLLNPVEVARILALRLLDPTLEVLGPVGGYLIARLGPAGAVVLLLLTLAGWTVAPLAFALVRFESRDPL